MRGKASDTTLVRMPDRIIPAHAGKSTQCQAWIGIVRDHPRSCGEKWDVFEGQYFPEGSSPLMRGKAARGERLSSICGIIPAHAGKRSGTVCTGCSAWDHPRSCGEKDQLRRRLGLCGGSSPLMRGKDLNKSQKPNIFAEHFTFPSAFCTQNGSACNQPTPDVSPPYPIGNIPLSFPVCNLRSL